MILKICQVLRVANSKDEYNGLRFEDTHGFKCTVLCVCVGGGYRFSAQVWGHKVVSDITFVRWIYKASFKYVHCDKTL